MKKTLRALPSDIFFMETERGEGEYLLQSAAWARVKAQFGWVAHAFRQTRYDNVHKDVLVLLQRVRGFGYLMYVPDGLLLRNVAAGHSTNSYREARENAFNVLFDIARLVHARCGKRVFCVRWDAPWCVRREDLGSFFSDVAAQVSRRAPVHKCAQGNVYGGAYVQPPATVIVDLNADEEQILKDMKAKTRYNIRLAQKRGVVIREGLALDAFYALYEVTSKRNGIAIHSKAYYAAVLEALRAGSGSEVRMYGAYYEGELIAAGIISYYGTRAAQAVQKEACYLYGATSNEHRNLMPMYLLQWHAMREAKKATCTRYDLFGIPLHEGSGSTMQGLHRFKVGFGGAVYVRGGGFACVPAGLVAHARYALFCLAECAYTRVLKLRATLQCVQKRR